MKYLKYFENYGDYSNKWELLLSNPEKKIRGESLIDLVNNAYKITNLGSFVKTIRDVIKSEWFIIDWDDLGDIDACLFYRKPRPNEVWIGKKFQGVGHDGRGDSKKILLEKLCTELKKEGNWIEASDKLESILENRGIKKITDIRVLKKLFPGSKILKIHNNGRYDRTLENGVITESVFGNPVF
jgi:hypothetical protein